MCVTQLDPEGSSRVDSGAHAGEDEILLCAGGRARWPLSKVKEQDAEAASKRIVMSSLVMGILMVDGRSCDCWIVSRG